MVDTKKYQHLRIITEDGRIFSGDLKRDGITYRVTEGFLNDVRDEQGKVLPAVESEDGTHVEFWKNGVLHAEEGPAIIDAKEKYEAWFYEGREVPAL